MTRWLRSPWLLLLLLLPAALGLSRLRFNVEVLDLLPADLPAVQGLKSYQRFFANTRELVITITADNPDQAELAASSLASHLTNHLDLTVQWEAPWRTHPQAIAEFLAFLWLNQSPDDVRQLATRLAPDRLEPSLEQLRERLATSLSPDELGRAGYDPFNLSRLPFNARGALPDFNGGNEMFASPDGTFRVLYVQSRLPLPGYRDSARWLQLVQQHVGEWQQQDPANAPPAIAFTGQPAFMAEIGGGMERDMIRSVLGTLVIISVLFLWVHRRLAPLLWLVALLGLTLAGTLGFGGLWFGTLNVVSTGFAAILLGLAVDYGLVLYQEARTHPTASAPILQQRLAPSILWAATTTAAAFLALNLSDLPGLAQLGGLVTAGIILAAVLMLRLFLPPLLPLPPAASIPSPAHRIESVSPPSLMRSPLLWSTLLLVGAGFVLLRDWPAVDQGAAALRPRDSAAYAALDQIKSRMSGPGEPIWLLVHGTSEQQVAERLDTAEAALSHAQPLLRGVTLPTAFWPRPENQNANRAILAPLLARRDQFEQALRKQGFAPEAFVMTDRTFDTWQRAIQAPETFWPTNTASTWILNRFVARSPDQLHALGLIYPVDEHPQLFHNLNERLGHDGFQLASWAGLGDLVFERVKQELRWLSWLMIILMLTALSLAFRRLREVLLSLAALAFAFITLLATMSFAGWSWNLMNLMALPLLLGTSVDYSIHIQLALRRNLGDTRATRLGTGYALLLCGATTITAFSSLAWSSNAGLASLGKICAAGIACTMITTVFLLPGWWRAVHPTLPSPAADSNPSRLYGSFIWQWGCQIARRLPDPILHALSQFAASAFRILRPQRFQIVVHNLKPPLQNDPAAAHAVARRLFNNFGLKIAHLWAYESGCPFEHHVGQLEGRERFFAALQSGRGVLLISPHLGNWEFGAPLLAKHGIKLMAVTMEEPSPRLTELRRQSRRRWGIETIVIQRDPFAFLQVLRQLESGAAVALLVDRPPAATAVPVTLFGHTLDASVAPAELARASGCILLPVYVLHRPNGYHACVLPEIPYDRRSLRNPQARRALTQQIMRAFEPIIRDHLDQWYHFVPIWRTKPEPNTDAPPSPPPP